jgi:hypothetical protein
MTTNVTPLEAKLLKLIATDQFTDGRYGPHGHVWRFSVFDAFDQTAKGQFAGVVSSCVEKGFVKSVEDSKDSTPCLSSLGWSAYLETLCRLEESKL